MSPDSEDLQILKILLSQYEIFNNEVIRIDE